MARILVHSWEEEFMMKQPIGVRLFKVFDKNSKIIIPVVGALIIATFLFSLLS